MSAKHWIGAFLVSLLAVITVRLPLDMMGVPMWASFIVGVVAGTFACHFYRRKFDRFYANRED